MAKKSMILKQQKEQKFSTRTYNRCKICGRMERNRKFAPRYDVGGNDEKIV